MLHKTAAQRRFVALLEKYAASYASLFTPRQRVLDSAVRKAHRNITFTPRELELQARAHLEAHPMGQLQAHIQETSLHATDHLREARRLEAAANAPDISYRQASQMREDARLSRARAERIVAPLRDNARVLRSWRADAAAGGVNGIADAPMLAEYARRQKVNDALFAPKPLPQAPAVPVPSPPVPAPAPFRPVSAPAPSGSTGLLDRFRAWMRGPQHAPTAPGNVSYG